MYVNAQVSDLIERLVLGKIRAYVNFNFLGCVNSRLKQPVLHLSCFFKKLDSEQKTLLRVTF